MSDTIKFSDLGLPKSIMQAVESVGYETPSAIQEKCIPLLLEGGDLLGQAQTGTGKTAAFALPLLSRIDCTQRHPQLLILTPTRELAIQVAEAVQQYARFIEDFHILPIYGGQGFTHQLRELKRGVQVVVGTPGRVMDHMRRGTLKLDQLKAMVLDEADEMLRMGFIDDVEWILEQTNKNAQIALFSATMPKQIQRVAERYLKSPKIIKIDTKTSTVDTIRQRFWNVRGISKIDAMTRVLEAEEFDGVIVFVRTKTATIEIADKLAARGFSAEPLNGDIPQAQREKVVDRLKNGKVDILVATDVVARGLDVPRISLVINFDIPHDTESYVHRIGRTGRAGRKGDAILFVSHRERRLLFAIEKATSQPIEEMQMPSISLINETRVSRFKLNIIKTLEGDHDVSLFHKIVSEVERDTDFNGIQIAAALAKLTQGDVPLLLSENERKVRQERENGRDRFDRNDRNNRSDRGASRSNRGRDDAPKDISQDTGPLPLKEFPDIKMERYRIAVGYDHGVKPGNIVGAIANEAELESRYIGHIEIYEDFATVDLPDGMPPETLTTLKNAWVCKQKLMIEPLKGKGKGPVRAERKPPNSDKKKRRRSPKGASQPKGTGAGSLPPRRKKNSD